MIRLRPMVDADRSTIRRWWTRAMGAPKSATRHGLWPCPGEAGQISMGLWRKYVATMVADLLDTSTVLVAELESVPGEPLGFVAYTPGTPHEVFMVYVMGEARRNGFGMAILDAMEHNDLDVVPLYSTRSGDALLRAWQNRRKRAA